MTKYMGLEDKLKNRIGISDIHDICRKCSEPKGAMIIYELFSLIKSSDDRIGYNALWIITHLDTSMLSIFDRNKDELIDLILTTEHTGKRRLLLSIMNRLVTERDDIRTDYLNFCLSKINSTDPYAIRTLCLKEAYDQCRFYPELLNEFYLEVELMTRGKMSPGLISARNQVLKHKIHANANKCREKSND